MRHKTDNKQCSLFLKVFYESQTSIVIVYYFGCYNGIMKVGYCGSPALAPLSAIRS